MRENGIDLVFVQNDQIRGAAPESIAEAEKYLQLPHYRFSEEKLSLQHRMPNKPTESNRLVKLWGRPTAGDGTGNGDGNVTYASISKPNQSGFYCSLPPGSRHAATAQEICATMHSGRSISTEVQPEARLMTQESEPRRLIKGVFTQDEEIRDNRKGGRARSKGQRSQESHHRTQQQRPISSHGSRSHPVQVAAVAPPVAYRGDNGQKVEYYSQNGNGELYVSAPKGSGEAELFDDVAHMIANGGTRASTYREHVSQPKRRGWLTW